MNFALTEEQHLLVEAAGQALAGHDTLGAARAGLDEGVAPPLWEIATTAGWTGLLVAEARDGAGLGAVEALLVAEACGGRLAQAGLLGHVPATAVLELAGLGDRAFADGTRRLALVCDGVRVEGGRVDGTGVDVLDAPGADAFVVLGDTDVALVDAAGVGVHRSVAYDASLSLGTVSFDATACLASAPSRGASGDGAGALQMALLGAEALGAAAASLRLATAYAIDRMAFGRAIGSFQAIKHKLVEMLRLVEAARSLEYYAGWAWDHHPREFPLAAGALRVAGGDALDYAAPESIFIHGGIGSTWEHDAHLYYRRAEVLRRLDGGAPRAARIVAAELAAGARA